MEKIRQACPNPNNNYMEFCVVNKHGKDDNTADGDSVEDNQEWDDDNAGTEEEDNVDQLL